VSELRSSAQVAALAQQELKTPRRQCVVFMLQLADVPFHRLLRR
jgi:hypothetical protein